MGENLIPIEIAVTSLSSLIFFCFPDIVLEKQVF